MPYGPFVSAGAYHRWAKERDGNECFGDFVIRVGVVAPVIDSARDFYAA